ncbi:multiple sugar transport system ATP-binding protein/multiple sugar transport system ATP-binding protein [Pseudovibrio denitrificans]|uniref:Multiple sugar transport system ATP-binding protein/multiple sugar transport system ATP-binding protein n=1 Tax=Pseudovibrio denitrificans TaxID=258256 RepID=A0A1I7D1Q8_9HYPH|nr:sn-glycerol-3-phosphate ABC transporter ATP-binding protein UgpC [Pseudovibrio denitrificans]SFU05625.1 multiple sugar transport system ATP-binding protein/multiple sugar transport system ATP-binding protein [Pseudovibrio denitrificans]
MTTLTISNLCKSFGDVDVLHDINLAVQSGEFVVLVGPSGCGKSTLLRLIAGLEDIIDGTIQIGERVINDVEADKRGIAMVFQSYALYPHMSVEQNIGFCLRVARQPSALIREKVQDVAQTLQIEQLLKRKPGELSGGQRQRVAIGRAIVRDPDVFLFDEPLSNLDAELRVQMRLELMKLHNRLKATMIYVTHDQVEALTMADKIVVMRDGVIEQEGTPIELFNNPCNKFVAGFIGTPKMNFLHGHITTVTEQSLHLELGEGVELEIPNRWRGHDAVGRGRKVCVGIRPNEVVEGESGVSTLRGTISVVEQLGRETLSHMVLPNKQYISVLENGQHFHEPGTPWTVSLKPEAIYLFDEHEQTIALTKEFA